MRKAAATMYEQACRLKIECQNTLNTLQKQRNCLLATITSLHLVSPNYSWLVKPQDRNSTEIQQTSKRDQYGDILPGKPKIDVVDLHEIEKELEIVNAQLKLAKHTTGVQALVGTDIHELVGCLSSAGLYSTAISLCSKLKVSMRVPFEKLATACVRLTENDDIEAWNWMVLNDLSDLGIHEKNVGIVAWRLLQMLLNQHEQKSSTELHMAVTKRLLNSGAFLPSWLMASYKTRNASELLRLILLSGRLLEATELCKEYLWAALGRGYELFGMDSYLLSTSPPVCMPISTIDHLLCELNYLKDDEVYNKAFSELSEIVDYYAVNVKKTSEDMIKFRKNAIHG